MYDVIIAGAGPAGCTAAKILSEKGHSVLLAEKFAIPRYKSCSGQLIRKSEELVKAYFGEAVPDNVMCAPVQSKGMIFTNDTGKVYRFEQEGKNLWRSSFDGWLAEKAADSGAEVRDKTSVISCEISDNSVNVTLKSGKTYTESCAYLIDCEGEASNLRGRITGEVPKHIFTYQTYNHGSIDLDPHYFYAYLQPELSGYDAWFNVKDDYLILGTASANVTDLPGFYRRFTDYMKKHHDLKITEQIGEDKWIMPHIRPSCQINCGTGRVLFAGEAAGFLNPMGEGISSALESGYCAALAVSENFDVPENLLDDYSERLKPLHSYMKSQWRFTARISPRFDFMK